LGICTILDNGATELDHFVWNPLPSPQYAGVPFNAIITAKDGRDKTVSAFNGSARLKALASSQAITVGGGARIWNYPLGTRYHDSRLQSIYLAAEIGGAGRIGALALN